jgi:hypothetical protein
LLLIQVFNQAILIEDKFNKEEVITNSQIMKRVHEHQNSVERKMEWHLNFMKLKPNKIKEYKLKPTLKQSKPIPIQTSQREKTKNPSKISRDPRF